MINFDNAAHLHFNDSFFDDDLVLMKVNEELLREKIKKWKQSMEGKGLRVNLGKTKVMRCRVSGGQVEKSGKRPCSVCRKGVGERNAIRCMLCQAWVLKWWC